MHHFKIDRELLDLAAKFAGVNDHRNHLNGVAVTHDGKLWATDAYIAIRTHAVAITADAPAPISELLQLAGITEYGLDYHVIPRDTIKAALKAADKDQPVLAWVINSDLRSGTLAGVEYNDIRGSAYPDFGRLFAADLTPDKPLYDLDTLLNYGIAAEYVKLWLTALAWADKRGDTQHYKTPFRFSAVTPERRFYYFCSIFDLVVVGRR